MDPYFWERDKKRGKRSARKSGDESGELFPDAPVPTDGRTAPFQPGSETSRDAAERISPRTEDHKAICYRAILHATRTGDFITRKEIAVQHFDKQQNFVTGRVHDLIHKDKLVYEVPVRINGVISRDAESGEPLIEKRDGSALLAAKIGADDGQ